MRKPSGQKKGIEVEEERRIMTKISGQKEGIERKLTKEKKKSYISSANEGRRKEENMGIEVEEENKCTNGKNKNK